MDDWEQHIRGQLESLRSEHRYRRRCVLRPLDSTHVELDGRRYVNFSSNNYLGLTHHAKIVSAFQAAAARWGTGAGAASLISGYGDAHASAEQAIARWKGTEAAVLLPSGYQANHAAVQALAALAGDGGLRFLLDKLVHASLIDAVRAAGVPFRVFPHNQLDKLNRLLAEGLPTQRQVVVTESIFSMDGDDADLAALAALKQHHPFLLFLDEAHASGIYGPDGAGLAAERGLQASVDISAVTLSKAIGLSGAALCGSSAYCEAVMNFGRAAIFSTNVPPAIAAAAEAALGVLRDEPERRLRVRNLSQRLRSAIRGAGWEIPIGDSPIIPVIVGQEEDALAAADKLKGEGLLVVAVRPPTVPRGSSRLRVTLSNDHTDAEVDHLIRALTLLRR